MDSAKSQGPDERCCFEPAHIRLGSGKSARKTPLDVLANSPRAFKALYIDERNLEDLRKVSCKLCKRLHAVITELNDQARKNAMNHSKKNPPCKIIVRRSFSGALCVRITVWGTAYYRLSKTPIEHPGQDPVSGLGNHTLPKTIDILQEPERLATLQTWLSECDQNHRCLRSSEPLLPTRILTITDDGNLRLQPGNDRRGLYTTLSHCWGEVRPTCLTLDNLQELSANGIHITNLPLTYRHAVQITQSLSRKIKHIWIDSLCIIQDDLKDWAAESKRMASVYGNSYLNIAAATAKDAQAGCFTADSPGRSKRSSASTYFLPKSGLYAHQLELHPEYCVLDPVDLASQSQTPPPLLTRAWVLQERLLASRVVYFDHNELLWECLVSADCSCSSLAICPTLKGHWSDITATAKIDSSLWIMRWRELIHAYSSLALTYGTDRLQALEGVVDVIQNRLGERKYMYGIWTINMKFHLAWEVLDFFPPPSQPVAPSWSWASVEGRVYFHLAIECGAQIETLSAWRKRVYGTGPNGTVGELHQSCNDATIDREGHQNIKTPNEELQIYLQNKAHIDEIEDENSWCECECEEGERTIVILGSTLALQATVTKPVSTTGTAEFVLGTSNGVKLLPFQPDIISTEHIPGFTTDVKLIWLATDPDGVVFFLVLTRLLDGTTSEQENVTAGSPSSSRPLTESWQRLGLLKVDGNCRAKNEQEWDLLTTLLRSHAAVDEALYIQ